MRPMARTSMSTTARSTATSNGCARSSRRSMAISRRSKRCMASDIDTATAEADDAAAGPADAERSAAAAAFGTVERPSAPSGSAIERRPRLGRRLISPLTRRIIAVNVLPLLLLAAGFLYLGKFQSSLIGQQIESLRTQGEIFAAALGEGAVLQSTDEGETLLPELSRQMMRRLVEPTRTRARLFAIDGKLIADSRLLRGPGDAVQVAELPAPDTRGLIRRLPDKIYDWVVDLLPNHRRYPPYHEGGSAEDYREAMQALHGGSASIVRSDPSAGG